MERGCSLHGFTAVAPLKQSMGAAEDMGAQRLHGFTAVAPLKRHRDLDDATRQGTSPRLHRRGPIEATYWLTQQHRR